MIEPLDRHDPLDGHRPGPVAGIDIGGTKIATLIVDSDGAVFGPGDFVSYQAGTHHNSSTDNGCLLAVFEWRRP